MKISNKVTEQIGKLIAGDIGSSPYLTGPKLVTFYNECGFDDIYGEGFPSRHWYSTDKINKSNGTARLKTILEDFVDPRRYRGDESLTKKIAKEINQLIKYDGFALIKKRETYKIYDIQSNIIESDSISKIGHDFIKEQIEKCLHKISTNDFNGAITNARTLCEATLIHIIETIENQEIKNDGNILNLWKQAKKSLKLDLKKNEIPDFIFQILTGLESSINGLASLSNNASDRHATKFTTEKHHAKLAVNSTMTFCDFLIDVLNKKETGYNKQYSENF